MQGALPVPEPSAPTSQGLLDSTEAIKAALSVDRFTTYLNAAGGNEARAFALYLWNAKMGEAFHLPIQALEVCLRNSINRALCNRFGPRWWESEGYLALACELRQHN